MSCVKCSVRIPADDKAFLLVSGATATFIGSIPEPLPPHTTVFMLDERDGIYRVAAQNAIEAGQGQRVKPTLKPLNPRTERPPRPDATYSTLPQAFTNPWAVAPIAEVAPEPSTGDKQFLAIPAKFAPYLTNSAKLHSMLADEAEAYTSNLIGESYIGDFVAGDEWEYEGERYCYVYVPLTEYAELTPTGAGGSPMRTDC